MLHETQVKITILMSEKILSGLSKENNFDVDLVIGLSDSLHKIANVDSLVSNPYDDELETLKRLGIVK